MELKDLPFRNPIPPESWVKSLTVYTDIAYKNLKFCLNPENKVAEASAVMRFSGRGEILKFEMMSDVPTRIFEPITIEFVSREVVGEINVGNNRFFNYGTLSVLPKLFELPSGEKIDELWGSIGIPSKDFHELQQCSFERAAKSTFSIRLGVLGLGLEWDRKGSLHIVDIDLNWKFPMTST